MKKTLTTLLSAGILASGCSQNEGEDFRIWDANKALQDSIPRIVKVHISLDGVGFGKERIFVDSDGDGKTVEEYVVRVNQSAIVWPIGRYESHLVRDNSVVPKYDPRENNSSIREMTSTEKERLDSEYQSLLRKHRSRTVVE